MRMLLAAFIAGLALIAMPAYAASTNDASINYTFNAPGVLEESPSAAESTSPYFWLKSGGELDISNDIGSTIAGDLPASDPLHAAYAKAAGADGGAHPQNLFVMFTKERFADTAASVYIRRSADHFTAGSARPYGGESIIARYQDGGTFYYGGIRADGMAVIKKKVNGVYHTLAQKKLFPGIYDASADPDLIPRNEWIGLKLAVTDGTGGPRLTLYTDIGRTGSWQQALSAVDDPARYGAPIAGTGSVGIESDYADAEFDNFLYGGSVSAGADVSAPTAAGVLDPASGTPAPPSSASTSPAGAPAPAESAEYDAVVLADHPAMYLAMDSASTGKEADLSGHGINGAYKGGAPSGAVLPNGDAAADFDGASEYLSVPSNPALSIPTAGKLTWEAWIRPDTLSFAHASGDGYVDWMGKCENYSPTCEWEARIYGASSPENRPDRVSAYVFNPSAGLGSAADWQPAAGVLAAGHWIHVVAEYDTTATPAGCFAAYPGSINIWVDGVKQDFAAHAPTGCMSQYRVVPRAGNSPLTIGTMAFDTWFKGAVGKVAVYDRLLSASDIARHYAAMTGRTPSGSCAAVCTVAPLP